MLKRGIRHQKRMTETEIKTKFAEAWLRSPDNAYAAALKVCKGDSLLALRMSQAWVNDLEVDQIKEELVARHGEDYFLPSRASMIHDILGRAKVCGFDDDYVKLMRLAADMRGFVEKPGVTITNNVTTNKVMVVPMRVGSNGQSIDSYEWERQLVEQQNTLISHG